jgi:hypothetical protein
MIPKIGLVNLALYWVGFTYLVKRQYFIIGIKILVTTVLCLGFLEKAKHLPLEYSSYDLLVMFPKILQKLAGWTDRWLG